MMPQQAQKGQGVKRSIHNGDPMKGAGLKLKRPQFFTQLKRSSETLWGMLPAYVHKLRNMVSTPLSRQAHGPHHAPQEKDFWERVEFTTRVQQVDKLQNCEPIKKRLKTRLQKRKRFRFGMNKRRNNNDNNNNSNSSENKNEDNESDSEDKFGFENGSDFTLEEFKDFSDEFKERHFRVKDDVNCSYNDKNNGSCSDNDKNNTNNMGKERWSPSRGEIEGEYWRIVEEADEEIEVHWCGFGHCIICEWLFEGNWLKFKIKLLSDQVRQVCVIGLEPEQSAPFTWIHFVFRKRRNIWCCSALALCRHVFFFFLLAFGGPSLVFIELYAFWRTKSVVWSCRKGSYKARRSHAKALTRIV